MKVRISHVLLENWRNFRKVDVELGARAFVVGPNASGKTNFLDSLRFLGDIAGPEGSLTRAVNTLRGGMAHLRSLHARQASRILIRVHVQVDADTWEYELSVNGSRTQPVHVESERVAKNGKNLFTRPNEQDKADPRLLQQTHLEQLSQNSSFRELVDALASISSVHIVPQVAKANTGSDRLILRDAPGSDFIAQLAELSVKKQRGALNKISKLLRIAVPQFSKLEIERERKTGIPHLMAKFEHWRAKGSWQSEQDLSDGTLRLIGFIWAILNGSGPLLLEEPELSLHRAVVRQIPRILARAAQVHERQVITSTHADEVLDDTGIDPSEVIILKPTAEDTLVTSGSRSEALTNAAKARVPLGGVVGSLTRPHGIEQLAIEWPGAATR